MGIFFFFLYCILCTLRFYYTFFQVEDLIYYVTAEEIQEGSEMRVWYATFYEQKLQEKFKSLGFMQNTNSSSAAMQRVLFRNQSNTQSPCVVHVVPSLSKIVVEKSQVIFTHTTESFNTTLKPPAVHESLFVTDKYFPGETVQRGQSHSVPSANYVHENNIMEKKRDQGFTLHDYRHIAGTNLSSALQSIELMNTADNLNNHECVVTITISAVPENYQPNSIHKNSDDDFEGDNCLTEDCEVTDGLTNHSTSNCGNKNSFVLSPVQKIINKKKAKSGMYARSLFYLYYFLHDRL